MSLLAIRRKKHMLQLKKRALVLLMLTINNQESAMINPIKKVKRNRRFWVSKIYKEREEKEEFHLLVKELKLHDKEYFYKCFRMSPSNFELLLSWVGPLIIKTTTKMRDPIHPSERLCVMLR